MKWEFKGVLREENFDNYESLNFTYLFFQNQNVHNIEINFETLREVKFSNCKFSDVNFNNTFFSHVQFINCEFTNVVFSDVRFSNVIISNSKLTSITFFESVANDLCLEESLIQYSKLENSEINNSIFEDVRFKENLHRKVKYNYTNFDRCELVSEKLIDVPFKSCDLKTSHFKEVSINIDNFITSTLSLLNIIEILGDKGIIIED